MGLLDDAIREHLELKRRRGADPGMVAREERDALAPVFPEEGDGLVDGDPSEAAREDTSDAEAVEEPHTRDAELADLSTVGQETAELDMQAVMDEDVDASGGSAAAPTDTPPAGDGYAAEAQEDPPPDWEVSSDAGPGPVSEDVPGQERLTFE